MNNITITNLQDCLDDVIDNRGVTPHKRGTEWQNAGIPVYSANNIKTSGIQKSESIRYIPEDKYSSWMKTPLEKGDILLTSEAPAGEVYYWDSNEKIVVGQRLYGLKVKKGINSKYLKYYLQSSIGQKAIQSHQSGSTVFGISAKTFPQITVLLPEKNVQDSIGDILYSIDSKISLNNKINDNLQQQAKLLYDYWFNQFEFPNEEGKPYKSSGGKMVWNEELKREIPEGWEVKEIGDLCSMGNGINYSKDVIGDKIYKIINVRNITSTSLMLNCYDFDDISLPQEQGNRYIVDKYGILVARSGTPGAIRLVYNGKLPIVYCGFIIQIIPYDKNARLYYAYTLKQYEGTNATQTGGSILKNVSQDTLSKLKIAIPKDNIINNFNKNIRNILRQIDMNIKETNSLSQLRNWLLPMLMNGQATVED